MHELMQYHMHERRRYEVALEVALGVPLEVVLEAACYYFLISPWFPGIM